MCVVQGLMADDGQIDEEEGNDSILFPAQPQAQAGLAADDDATPTSAVQTSRPASQGTGASVICMLWVLP